MSWRAILIFGPPGCGKGTQAKAICSFAPFKHVSSGDIFRSMPKTSQASLKLQEYTSKGLLVPDEVTFNICKNYLIGLENTFQFDPVKQILLLDGLPRTKDQVELFNSLLKVELILNLQVSSNSIIVERLKKRALIEGRLDDANEEVITKRLNVYHEQTSEVLNCFEPSLIANINADPSPFAVLEQVLCFLQKVKGMS